MKIQIKMDIVDSITSLKVVIMGKASPTPKLVSQLTSTAMLMAVGRGPCEKSSAVIIQGIEPK